MEKFILKFLQAGAILSIEHFNRIPNRRFRDCHKVFQAERFLQATEVN